jgi:N-acetylmuramoyl-L-alanine amidase
MKIQANLLKIRTRTLIFLGISLSLGSCAPQQRMIPPEVMAIHEQPPVKLFSLTKPEMIIIDAGHGGKDAGASSKKHAYEEKKLTLETAFLLSDYLKQMGYRISMTRKEDAFVALETRAEIANDMEADLFVSIHYNYSSDQDVEGIEVYYYKESKTPPSQRILQSKELGHEVLKKIVKITGAESRGVKQANFAVVRQTNMPAILIEGGFLSNPDERKKILDSKYLHQLAKSIAHGVDHYLTQHRK